MDEHVVAVDPFFSSTARLPHTLLRSGALGKSFFRKLSSTSHPAQQIHVTSPHTADSSRISPLAVHLREISRDPRLESVIPSGHHSARASQNVSRLAARLSVARPHGGTRATARDSDSVTSWSPAGMRLIITIASCKLDCNYTGPITLCTSDDQYW